MRTFQLLLIACAVSTATATTSWAQAPAAPARGAQGPAGGGRQGRGGQAPGAPATPRYVPADPIDFNDHAGWTSMFDGKTLNGWDGSPIWHVEDGALTVQSKADPPTGSVYLLYTKSEPKDFEFKWEVKLEGTGPNSGVQFRSTRLSVVPDRPNSKWETRGYQADFDNGFFTVNATDAFRQVWTYAGGPIHWQDNSRWDNGAGPFPNSSEMTASFTNPAAGAWFPEQALELAQKAVPRL